MALCIKCILPDSFPDANFDKNGICSYCRIHEKNPRITRNPLGSDALKASILSRRERGSYDCIVPLSGGKDSSYILYFVVTKLGMKPLAVSVDSGFMHPDARKNIESLCGDLGVDLVMKYSKYRKKHVKEALIISKETGEDFPLCGGCETDIRSIVINEANKHSVKSVIYGSTDFEMGYRSFGESQQPTFRELFDHKQDKKWSLSKFPGKIKKLFRASYLGYINHFFKLKIPFIKKISSIYHLSRYILFRILDNLDVQCPEGMNSLLPNVVVSFDDKDLDIIYFFDYIQYDPVNQVKELLTNTGWRASKGKESRMDCLIHPIASYRHLLDTGITSDGFTSTVLIRYNLMDRDEANQREQSLQNEVQGLCIKVARELGVTGLFENNKMEE